MLLDTAWAEAFDFLTQSKVLFGEQLEVVLNCDQVSTGSQGFGTPRICFKYQEMMKY